MITDKISGLEIVFRGNGVYWKWKFNSSSIKLQEDKN